MNISKAAKKSQLSVRTIRYYSDIDLLEHSKRSESGYRIFNETDIRKLVFIRRAREFGFSISECRALLDLYSNEKRNSSEVKKIAKKRLNDIEKKKYELQILSNELSGLIKKCLGDSRPDCPIIEELSHWKFINFLIGFNGIKV